ncbi:hypothetical protein WMF18_16580 [Sorangium sp. So ce315]|uniref:hypothetical protein n=1 Tax=Sorangium sp. So ce315 TaxID=3133299 RepID=UPI003F5DBD53
MSFLFESILALSIEGFDIPRENMRENSIAQAQRVTVCRGARWLEKWWCSAQCTCRRARLLAGRSPAEQACASARKVVSHLDRRRIDDARAAWIPSFRGDDSSLRVFAPSPLRIIEIGRRRGGLLRWRATPLIAAHLR